MQGSIQHDKMNQNPLAEITQKIAGHIRAPMHAHEIAKELESGEYSSELVMQHLLLFVDLIAIRLQDPHAVRIMILRGEIILPTNIQIK